ncbi:hypothetical protein HYDPIDRAFT_110214 [Hydnomerulius pinastri MD-312]|nr:hypothetical protein HYDPIDRAFT_110214 [Hydnomerulius pinastri MD-312]
MTADSQQCQAEACALQSCLSSNTYSPEKCDEYVRRLYTCCSEMYKREGGTGNAESTACPVQSAVERWLKRHSVSQV